MNLDLVIQQLRGFATLFGNRVAGAAEFNAALETDALMTLPAAYVLRLQSSPTENDSLDGLYQVSTRRIAVAVALDNSAERRGQAAITSLDAIEAALFGAILNWRPDPDRSARGFASDGDHLLHSDRARLWHQFEFVLEETITDADGFQPGGDPLVEIDLGLDLSQPPDGIADTSLHVILPQS